jgi:hypothetical protein
MKNGRYEEFGEIRWYLNGVHHRVGGPAVVQQVGQLGERSIWMIHGEYHREDGPAIEWDTGKKEWWLTGRKLTEEEFNQWRTKKDLNEKLHLTLPEKSKEKKNKI